MRFESKAEFLARLTAYTGSTIVSARFFCIQKKDTLTIVRVAWTKNVKTTTISPEVILPDIASGGFCESITPLQINQFK